MELGPRPGPWVAGSNSIQMDSSLLRSVARDNARSLNGWSSIHPIQVAVDRLTPPTTPRHATPRPLPPARLGALIHQLGDRASRVRATILSFIFHSRRLLLFLAHPTRLTQITHTSCHYNTQRLRSRPSCHPSDNPTPRPPPMRSARALASLRGRVVTSHDPPAPSPALLWTSSCQTNSVPSRRRPTGVCTPTSTSSASISDSRPGSIRGIFTVHAPEGNHRTSHRRKIHSSSSALAQPLETPITSPGGEEWEWHPDYATAPDSFLSPRIPFQPPPAPIHPNSTPASTSTAASLASAKPAPAPVSASQAEYIPSESDFDPHVDAYDDSYTFTHGPSPSPLPPAPELPSYADPAPSRPRRRTRNVLPDLPPLPAGQLPPDGQTRHDWRARATSRASKGKGKRWFPDLARRRESAAMTQLQPGEVYHEEVERYWAQ
jgi:hypothetical protein